MWHLHPSSASGSAGARLFSSEAGRSEAPTGLAMRRRGVAISGPAPSFVRMPLAIAAALSVHLLVVAASQVGTRTLEPFGATMAMTVRFVEAAVPTAARPQAGPANEESNAVEARQSAPIPGRPTAIAGLEEPRRPSSMPATVGTGPTSSASNPAEVRVAAEPQPLPDARATRPSTALPPIPALPPAPAYLLGSSLDVGPQPMGEIEPEYPDSANLQEGKVVVRVLISDSGSVDNVAVVRSAPAGLFDQSALEAFGKAQFSPGRSAGVPVKSQITVEVHFLPINRGSRISGRGY